MAGTKFEIKMKKAEPGSWAKLFVPREVSYMYLCLPISYNQIVLLPPLRNFALCTTYVNYPLKFLGETSRQRTNKRYLKQRKR